VSSDAVQRYLPLDAQQMSDMPYVWPSSTCITSPVSMFHILAVLSAAKVTKTYRLMLKAFHLAIFLLMRCCVYALSDSELQQSPYDNPATHRVCEIPAIHAQ
jgi:hypothetical protein